MKGQNSPKVQILLSTFNGEKYLNELLNSLLAQDYPDFSVLIRDDGSKDSTPGILSEYKGLHNNIELIYGENIGVVRRPGKIRASRCGGIFYTGLRKLVFS